MKKIIITMIIMIVFNSCTTTALIGESELEVNSVKYPVERSSFFSYTRGLSWATYSGKENSKLKIDEKESTFLAKTTKSREGHASVKLLSEKSSEITVHFTSTYLTKTYNILGLNVSDIVEDSRILVINYGEESYSLDLDSEKDSVIYKERPITIERVHKWSDDWSKSFYGWIFRFNNQSIIAVDVTRDGMVWVSNSCDDDMLDYLAGAVSGYLLYTSIDP